MKKILRDTAELNQLIQAFDLSGVCVCVCMYWKCSNCLLIFVRPGVSDVQRSTVEVDEPSSNSSLEHQPESSLSDENPAAKSLQKLEKKMKSIEELKERKSKGIKLEANQVLMHRIFY